MTEIVINTKFGGFGLSHKGVMKYAELAGLTLYFWIDDLCAKVYGDKATLENPSVLIHYTLVPKEEYEQILAEEEKKLISPGRYEKSNKLYFSVGNIPRDDRNLLQVVRKLGEGANARFAKLKIVEIPNDADWEIEEYDGKEWIVEKHSRWN